MASRSHHSRRSKGGPLTRQLRRPARRARGAPAASIIRAASCRRNRRHGAVRGTRPRISGLKRNPTTPPELRGRLFREGCARQVPVAQSKPSARSPRSLRTSRISPIAKALGRLPSTDLATPPPLRATAVTRPTRLRGFTSGPGPVAGVRTDSDGDAGKLRELGRTNLPPFGGETPKAGLRRAARMSLDTKVRMVGGRAV